MPKWAFGLLVLLFRSLLQGASRLCDNHLQSPESLSTPDANSCLNKCGNVWTFTSTYRSPGSANIISSYSCLTKQMGTPGLLNLHAGPPLPSPFPFASTYRSPGSAIIISSSSESLSTTSALADMPSTLTLLPTSLWISDRTAYNGCVCVGGVCDGHGCW